MRTTSIALTLALASIAGPLAPAAARAEGAALPPAGEAESPPPPDDAGFKRVSININPLSIAIGRYSVQGEFLPAPHHAVTLNPFYTHAPVKVEINGEKLDGGSLNGFGAELGYRFYTGSKGPNGFFVGPSFLFGSYSQSAPSGSQPPGGGGSDSFTSYGGAIDIGGQAVVGPGIVVGGGFGLQYTKTSRDIDTDNLNLASAVIAGDGIRPRFLFTLGYAF